MSDKEAVEHLVGLIRGFFTAPVLSSLGRLGVLEQMRRMNNFDVNSFEQVVNKKLLSEALNYLNRLGLIEQCVDNHLKYNVSNKGAEIFRRVHSFYVPHSYLEYLYNFHDMIQSDSGEIVPVVERLENVIGSGLTHLRYFPPAVSFLKRKTKFQVLVDIGCGDGHFLSSVVSQIPDKKYIGIDLSEISTEHTKRNLMMEYKDIDLSTFSCDGGDVKTWSKFIPKIPDKGSVAISMWFLIQEISKKDPEIVIEFLNNIRKIFPSSPLIIGEMVQQPDEILVRNNHRSLIPEYLFFHEMSNQGVLSWDDYKMILSRTGYEIVVEKLFDEVPDMYGRNIPSTFVWCLIPKE